MEHLMGNIIKQIFTKLRRRAHRQATDLWTGRPRCQRSARRNLSYPGLGNRHSPALAREHVLARQTRRPTGYARGRQQRGMLDVSVPNKLGSQRTGVTVQHPRGRLSQELDLTVG